MNSVRSWKAVGAAVILAVLCIGAASVGARNDDNSGWGEVYCLTNDPDGNELAVFARDNKGHLGNPSFVPTGGDGTGTGLGNQGALALDADGNHLYAVNPGSDSITVFRLTRSGPQVLQTVPSGGRRPVSLAVYRNLLYVLNAGGSVGDEDGIAGFAIRGNGRLLPLNGSRQRLSAKSTGPAQIAFSPSGESLLVTEKGTNAIDAFSLNRHGVPVDHSVEPSVGHTPFGFAFSRNGFLVVSEAFGGAAGASAVSSYSFDDDDGMLETISASIPTKQSAACWIALTQNGGYAYTTNTGSNSITGYKLSGKGKLTRLNENGVTAGTGAAPTDMTVFGSQTLFVLNSNDGSVGSYQIRDGGALKPIEVVGGLTPGFHPTGLVVR